MSEFDRGWNAAIEAAKKAVTKAPIFPRGKDYGGPAMDAERLRLLTIFEQQIEALRK